MNLVGGLLLLISILDVSSTQDAYATNLHLTVPWDNDTSVVAVAKKYPTVYFLLKDKSEIREAYVTNDFKTYTKSPEELKHLLGRGINSVFLLNEKSTFGEWPAGVTANGTRSIISLFSNGSEIVFKCQSCINATLDGDVQTARDFERKRWVTFARDCNGKRLFAVSYDLTSWLMRDWLLDSAPGLLDRVLEILPARDIWRRTSWGLLYKSEPDADGLTRLMYSTFVPDDYDQKYREGGVFDYSTDWEDVAVVRDGYQYDTRYIIAVKTSNYSQYGLPPNRYITKWNLEFDRGFAKKKSYMAFEEPTYQRVFKEVSLPSDPDPFTHLRPSVSYDINTHFRFLDSGRHGFLLFVNPNDRSQYGVSVTFNMSALTVERQIGCRLVRSLRTKTTRA